LDGRLLVVPVQRPVILPVALNGANLNLQFQSEAGVNYVLQAATNLAVPIFWTSISTNTGTGGILTFSPPVDPLEPQQYFRVMAY
jgi:hypothetical protein